MTSDLGVIINQNLSFNSHISRIIAKARSRCIIFPKSFISRNNKLMLKFFTCYVRPILEYCSPVWFPTLLQDIDRIERVQRSFTKKILGCTFLPYFQRLVKLSLHSLRHRRLVTILSTLFFLISGHTFASLYRHVMSIPPSVTRSYNLQIYVPTLILSIMGKTFCHVVRPPGTIYHPPYWQPNLLNHLETINFSSSLTCIVYNPSPFISSCFIVVCTLCQTVLLL